MARNSCPECSEDKDTRAKMCSDCRFRLNHPRVGTSKWGLHSSGYVVRHLDGRHQYKHRYVMEQYLGRRLRSDEHVHHIDHNRLNNDISNLEILSPEEHGRLHMTSEVARKLSKLGHKKRWGI